MPSLPHEILIALFRNHPALAAQLLRGPLQQALPAFTKLRLVSGDLTQIVPTERRADLVLLLKRKGRAVQAIIVEAQLSIDPKKRYSWPTYLSTLRERLKCPVDLLVVTMREAVARWAAKPIALGLRNTFTPWVLGPSGIPQITDTTKAKRQPALAVLSVMAHGRDPDAAKAARVALAAQAAAAALDTERATLYVDFTYLSLSAPARRRLEKMLQTAKYTYQSDFAKRFVAEGRKEGRKEGEAKGRAEGERAAILKLLTARFGVLPESAQQRVKKASVKKLDAIGERLLTAKTLKEALG